MKPPVGSRVMSEGKSGTVKAHRPGSMVDVRWDDKDYDMRTDASSLTPVRTNSGVKFKPVFVAAVLPDEAKQVLYNYWISQPGAPAALPVLKMSHMTIKFRPSPEEVAAMPIGQPVQLRVVGWAANNQIQAVAVQPIGVGSANATPHVTFALADASVAPKLSNDLFAGTATSGSATPGPVLNAVLGWSDGGKYHFSVPGMASNPGPRGGLTPSERGRLPDSAFALPGRRFPINDANHGRIALQYILAGRVAERDVNDVVSAVLARWGDDRQVRAFYEKHKKKLTRANVEKIHVRRVAANPSELARLKKLLTVSYEDAPAYFAAEKFSTKLAGKKQEFAGRWVLPSSDITRVSVRFGDAVADFMVEKFRAGRKDRLTEQDREAIFDKVNRAEGSPFDSLADFDRQREEETSRFEAFMSAFHAAPPALQVELTKALTLNRPLRRGVVDVRQNPEGDVYDPAKEQFRAVVQGVYESRVRKELGLPYNAPFESKGRRLDAALSAEDKRKLLSSAYAIATRQGQKHGWLVPGTQEPTSKGRQAAQQRLFDTQHASENRQDYERTLGSVRKSGQYRVVEEMLDGRPVFVVQPRPPEGVKIPKYRLSREAAEADAAEAARSFRQNPYYVIERGPNIEEFDIADEPAADVVAPGDTFEGLARRIGVSPAQLIWEHGDVERPVQDVRTGKTRHVPVPGRLRKVAVPGGPMTRRVVDEEATAAARAEAQRKFLQEQEAYTAARKAREEAIRAGKRVVPPLPPAPTTTGRMPTVFKEAQVTTPFRYREGEEFYSGEDLVDPMLEGYRIPKSTLVSNFEKQYTIEDMGVPSGDARRFSNLKTVSSDEKITVKVPAGSANWSALKSQYNLTDDDLNALWSVERVYGLGRKINYPLPEVVAADITSALLGDGVNFHVPLPGIAAAPWWQVNREGFMKDLNLFIRLLKGENVADEAENRFYLKVQGTLQPWDYFEEYYPTRQERVAAIRKGLFQIQMPPRFAEMLFGSVAGLERLVWKSTFSYDAFLQGLEELAATRDFSRAAVVHIPVKPRFDDTTSRRAEQKIKDPDARVRDDIKRLAQTIALSTAVPKDLEFTHLTGRRIESKVPASTVAKKFRTKAEQQAYLQQRRPQLSAELAEREQRMSASIAAAAQRDEQARQAAVGEIPLIEAELAGVRARLAQMEQSITEGMKTGEIRTAKGAFAKGGGPTYELEQRRRELEAKLLDAELRSLVPEERKRREQARIAPLRSAEPVEERAPSSFDEEAVKDLFARKQALEIDLLKAREAREVSATARTRKKGGRGRDTGTEADEATEVGAAEGEAGGMSREEASIIDSLILVERSLVEQLGAAYKPQYSKRATGTAEVYGRYQQQAIAEVDEADRTPDAIRLLKKMAILLSNSRGPWWARQDLNAYLQAATPAAAKAPRAFAVVPESELASDESAGKTIKEPARVYQVEPYQTSDSTKVPGDEVRELSVERIAADFPPVPTLPRERTRWYAGLFGRAVFEPGIGREGAAKGTRFTHDIPLIAKFLNLMDKAGGEVGLLAYVPDRQDETLAARHFMRVQAAREMTADSDLARLLPGANRVLKRAPRIREPFAIMVPSFAVARELVKYTPMPIGEFDANLTRKAVADSFSEGFLTSVQEARNQGLSKLLVYSPFRRPGTVMLSEAPDADKFTRLVSDTGGQRMAGPTAAMRMSRREYEEAQIRQGIFARDWQEALASAGQKVASDLQSEDADLPLTIRQSAMFKADRNMARSMDLQLKWKQRVEEKGLSELVSSSRTDTLRSTWETLSLALQEALMGLLPSAKDIEKKFGAAGVELPREITDSIDAVVAATTAPESSELMRAAQKIGTVDVEQALTGSLFKDVPDEKKAGIADLFVTVANALKVIAEQVQESTATSLATSQSVTSARLLSDDRINEIRRSLEAADRTSPRMPPSTDEPPAAFWDIVWDEASPTKEAYILYVNTDKFRFAIFEKEMSGDVKVYDRNTRRVVGKPGPDTSGVPAGPTSEELGIMQALEVAEENDDKVAARELRGQLAERKRARRAHRAQTGTSPFLSPYRVIGFQRAEPLIMKRLAKFAPQRAAAMTSTGSPMEQLGAMSRALTEASMQRIQQSGLRLTAGTRTAAQTTAPEQTFEDPRRGWVPDRRFRAEQRKAAVVIGAAGTREFFDFALSKYAAFKTYNPRIAAATILYWETPELVQGAAIDLPHGRTFITPSGWTSTAGDDPVMRDLEAIRILPTNVRERIQDEIDSLRFEAEQAAIVGDNVTLGKALDMLYGITLPGGSKVPGLIDTFGRIMSKGGAPLSSRANLIGRGGKPLYGGRLSIEGAPPVTAYGQGRMPAVPALRAGQDTALVKLLTKNLKAEITEARFEAARKAAIRAQALKTLAAEVAKERPDISAQVRADATARAQSAAAAEAIRAERLRTRQAAAYEKFLFPTAGSRVEFTSQTGKKDIGDLLQVMQDPATAVVNWLLQTGDGRRVTIDPLRTRAQVVEIEAPSDVDADFKPGGASAQDILAAMGDNTPEAARAAEELSRSEQAAQAQTRAEERAVPAQLVISMDRITRKDLQDNPQALFVFGDNMQRRGMGGQAKEMRGERNAVGIPTKKSPAMTANAFFSDADFPKAQVEIDKEFDRLEAHVRAGGVVVYPKDGIGSGSAKLKEKAPKIAEYLQKRYVDLISLGLTVQQQLAASVSANPRYQKGPRNFNTPQPRATLMRNGATRARLYTSSRLMPLVFE